MSHSHYPTLLIVLLALILLLAFPMVYPKSSCRLIVLLQVSILGMALLLFIIELYQALMG